MDWIKDNGQQITLNDRQATTDKAIELGWTRADVVNDGDKGSGIPGTIEWHESAIKGCESKIDVIEYLNGLTGPEGLDFDTRGNLATIKKRAIGWINDNSTADTRRGS